MKRKIKLKRFQNKLGSPINIVYTCTMESLKVDRTKLYTQAEYAKKIGVTRARVNHMIKAKQLETVEIKGSILVYDDK